MIAAFRRVVPAHAASNQDPDGTGIFASARRTAVRMAFFADEGVAVGFVANGTMEYCPGR